MSNFQHMQMFSSSRSNFSHKYWINGCWWQSKGQPRGLQNHQVMLELMWSRLVAGVGISLFPLTFPWVPSSLNENQ